MAGLLKKYPGHRPHNFIVLGSGRTGSNYLQTLLNDHSRIVCLGEILAHGLRTDMLSTKINILMKDPWTKNIVERKPEFPKKERRTFVNKFFGKQYPGISASGFRIFYEHTQNSTDAPIWRFLSSLEQLKIIHLIRKNHLRRYVSLIQACHSGVWVTHEKQGVPAKVHLDYKNCLDFMVRSERKIHSFREFLKDRHVLEIHYEDMLENLEGQLSRILDYLNLGNEQLSSPLEKINTLPLNEVIENYEDLKERFRDTRWTNLFED